MPRSPHILVVDDDADLRESICELLLGAGYQVTWAADGQQALGLLTHGHLPDLMLLDQRMPNKSGLDVLDAMRGSTTLIDLPVVVISANLSRPALGAVAWLKKPIPPQQLLSTVEHYTRQPSRTG